MNKLCWNKHPNQSLYCNHYQGHAGRHHSYTHRPGERVEWDDAPLAHAWYYDWTPDKRYSRDGEGNLAWLCSACAAQAGEDVQLAGGDEHAQDVGPCWGCGR